jgi:hypothetical protein
MSIALSEHDTNMAYNNPNSSFHLSLLQQHQQHQWHQHQLHLEKDRRVLDLNNRACVLVLSKGDYSEANEIFDAALMLHKEEAEEYSYSYSPCRDSFAVDTAASLPSVPSLSSNSDCNSNSDCDDYCEYDDEFGDMDLDDIHTHNPNHDESCCHTSIDSQLQQQQHHQQLSNDSIYNNSSSSKILHESLVATTRNKIPRMTSYSRLRSISYCGQQEYHNESGDNPAQCNEVDSHSHNHQVYSLPIVMDEMEWETAPIQDKSFVLIFNTALCNHLWGMQLMQQYIAATSDANNTNANANNASTLPVPSAAAMAEHCRETLTVAKLLYKLALENSVSFANGVDKMCYVALYNNLSHLCKTLEGYDSMEAQWCDDMLLKAIFWWRDSHQQQQPSNPSNNNNHQQRATSNTMVSASNAIHHHPTCPDRYLDDDVDIIDAFFDNVYYRVGVPEDIVPAAAA